MKERGWSTDRNEVVNTTEIRSLYITPHQPINYLDLYEGGRYKFNVISQEEYGNPARELQLSEAGCQGSYTPFGKKDIVLFMAKLIPTLFDLIENMPSHHIRITWKGHEKGFIQPPVKVSDFGLTLDSGQIKITSLL